MHKHLRMSHLALKYDTTQPQLVARFVDEVGSRSQLDLLFLVTCADLAAVGPDVLNSWKVEVLSELYFRAAAKVCRRGRCCARSRTRRRSQRGVAAAHAGRAQRRMVRAATGGAAGKRSSAKRPPAAVADTLRRLRTLAAAGGRRLGQLLEGNRHGRVHRRHRPGRRPGDLLQHGRRADEQQACKSWRPRPTCWPTACCCCGTWPRSRSRPASRRRRGWRRSASALVASIDSDAAPRFPKILGREQKEAGAALSNLPNEVRIDNEMSDECTVIEVFTVDRRGLLVSAGPGAARPGLGDSLRQDRHVSRPGGGRVLRDRARRAKSRGRRAAGGDSRRT